VQHHLGNGLEFLADHGSASLMVKGGFHPHALGNSSSGFDIGGIGTLSEPSLDAV
jgi:hypothetical protein